MLRFWFNGNNSWNIQARCMKSVMVIDHKNIYSANLLGYIQHI